jgi:sugar phosphate isomerase/epimerase
MIFVSTGGEKKLSAVQSCHLLSEAGLRNIELSGGAYTESLLQDLVKLKKCLSFQIHNYFPPPKIPYVFNLASLDPVISSQSIDHVKKAMQWSLELSRPIYSFHAGFLLDPRVDELGKRVARRTLFDREESLMRFIDRVNELAEEARTLGVKLLIENNVLSGNNYLAFQADPFLMTTASECLKIMSNTPKNVELLIDVAHLKVSSKTLNFDPIKFLDECHDWIGAYHLSDNDGNHDSNEEVSIKSWFWPYLKRNLDYYSLEVYGVTPDALLKQLSMAEHFLAKPNEIS